MEKLRLATSFLRWLIFYITDIGYFHGKRIKISELHEEKTKLALPKLKTSAKSVQTTAEV